MITFIVGVILFVYILVRLNKIESKINVLTMSSKLADKKPSEAPPTPQPLIQSTPQPTASDISTPIPPPTPSFTSAPMPASALSPAVAREKIVPKTNSDTEFAIGSRLLTIVGTIAVFLGVGFFLRYAFENDLITETMRVVLGVIAGFISIGIGHYLRTKYREYGLGLVGVGIGILYLTTYAAYTFYNLISVPAAFVVLILITAAGVGLSLLYNSKILICYSFAGAFIISLLLPLTVSVHGFFMYFIVLSIGLLVIGYLKTWPELAFESLIGMGLVSFKWIYSIQAATLKTETFAYITIIFALYVIVTILNSFRENLNDRGYKAFLLYATPIIYILLMWQFNMEKTIVAYIIFGVGLFYAITAVLIRTLFRGEHTIEDLSNAMLLIAASCIAVSSTIYYSGRILTTMWALEAMVILIAGIAFNSRSNRIAALILTVLTGIRLIGIETVISPTAVAVFNARAAVFALVTLLFVSVWMYYRYNNKQVEVNIQTNDEYKVGKYLGAIGAYCIPLLWLVLEESHFLKIHNELYLSLVLTFYFTLTICISFIAKENIFRFMSYILGGIITLVLLSTLWVLPSNYYELILNIRVISTIAFVISLGLLYWFLQNYRHELLEKEKDMSQIVLALINALLLWVVSIEVTTYYASEENTKRVVLSVVWLIFASIDLVLGIILRSSFARYFSIGLFMFTVLKIFLYDTANLNDIYRFISFISLGVILLLAGYTYYRFKDRILHFVQADQNPNY